LIAVGSTGAFRGISRAYALYRRISHMLSDVSATSIIQLSLGLLALIFVGWLAVWQVRRRLTRPDETSGAGFTLSDLRQLHKSGQMTDAEFERAKAKVVEAARRATERDQARAAAAGRSGGELPGGGLRGSGFPDGTDRRNRRPPPTDADPDA
jgi:hypothetical protein